MEEKQMKLIKILAIVLSLCLLSCVFIACDSADTPATETTAGDTPTTTIKVKLIIKDGSTTKWEEEVTCNGTLGNAIEMFCAGEFEEEFEVFNSTGLLAAIGDLKAGDGKSFKAYYEEEGQSKAFESIQTQELKEGKTVVIVLE
jgi:hypothetical protein